MLNPFKQDSRVRAAAEDRAVVGKGNAKGGASVDDSDSLIEGKGPEGGGTPPPPLGKTHA